MEAIEFQKVDKSTPLADDLLNFVENISCHEVKEHTIICKRRLSWQ